MRLILFSWCVQRTVLLRLILRGGRFRWRFWREWKRILARDMVVGRLLLLRLTAWIKSFGMYNVVDLSLCFSLYLTLVLVTFEGLSWKSTCSIVWIILMRLASLLRWKRKSLKLRVLWWRTSRRFESEPFCVSNRLSYWSFLFWYLLQSHLEGNVHFGYQCHTCFLL